MQQPQRYRFRVLLPGPARLRSGCRSRCRLGSWGGLGGGALGIRFLKREMVVNEPQVRSIALCNVPFEQGVGVVRIGGGRANLAAMRKRVARVGAAQRIVLVSDRRRGV